VFASLSNAMFSAEPMPISRFRDRDAGCEIDSFPRNKYGFREILRNMTTFSVFIHFTDIFQ